MEIVEATKGIEKLKSDLISVFGESFVITDEVLMDPYSKDHTMNLSFPFDILVKPATPEEIATILKLCNKYKIPVTPRGAGSGVTGGALPVHRGLVLSLERLNRIITINKVDGYIVAEAGVITADLCKQAELAGLYFPVAPSSSSFSFIGGNVAENAGSINACKYGTTAQYVMNLEVVTPTGNIIWTGVNVNKNTTGLNLTQLFIGSEGVLGVITKIVYKLIRKPAFEVSLLAGFESTEIAIKAVTELKTKAVSPSAVELIGHQAIQLTASYLADALPLINENIKTQLLVQLQEENEQSLNQAMELTASVLEGYCKEPILIATTAAEKEKVWKLRYSIGAAMTSKNKQYRDLDASVPLSQIYKYICQVELICSKYNIQLVYFGHVIDGNLHTMLVVDENRSMAEEKKIEQAVREIYSHAIALGGVISGEHGIGYLQKEFMAMQFSAVQLDLMKQIKLLFDPLGILNPGKFL